MLSHFIMDSLYGRIIVVIDDANFLIDLTIRIIFIGTIESYFSGMRGV